MFNFSFCLIGVVYVPDSRISHLHIYHGGKHYGGSKGGHICTNNGKINSIKCNLIENTSGKFGNNYMICS